jgi:fission process protein 1
MALPAFTIHSTVHLFKHVFHKVGRFQKWGPTVAGLAVVPALPYLFDHPVEHVVDKAFDYLWPVEKSSSHSKKHE